MRRRPHIAASLCTLAAGFLVAGAPGPLAYLLPAALALLLLHALAGRVRRAGYDPHRFKVAALTLALWVPLLAVYALIVVQPYTSCVINYDPEEYPREEAGTPPPARLTEPAHVEGVDGPCYVGESYSVSERVSLNWAGVLDRKALSKPRPSFPPVAAASQISGTVAVAVVVDEMGRVRAARALSGHPLLRPEAERAACLARFPHTFVDGPLAPKVRGVLTYNPRN